MIVGSCGTSGADAGVDWVYEIVREIAAERLGLRVARIYSEQTQAHVNSLLAEGRVHPLPPAEPLAADTVTRCSHIVGLMGHEPLAAALADGADVVLAGRTSDPALTAALPLLRGLPPGPVWHAAKIAESLAEDAACTPTSIAAHLLYENADPWRLREPGGTLDTTAVTYEALDDRRVRVEGQVWEPAENYTVKLEGSAPVGYQTMILSGIRDPEVLDHLDQWCDQVLAHLHGQIQTLLGLAPGRYAIQIRRYGHDAVLGEKDPARDRSPKEVGILFLATAEDQATATQVAKLANPVLLHAPLTREQPLPSFALFGSPAETERGLIHEFVLQHVVEVDHPTELFRTTWDQI